MILRNCNLQVAIVRIEIVKFHIDNDKNNKYFIIEIVK